MYMVYTNTTNTVYICLVRHDVVTADIACCFMIVQGLLRSRSH